MVGNKIHELTEGKGPWSYPERPGIFTPGALRLIQVKPLLSRERSRIVLYEFPESVLQCIQGNDGHTLPIYAAISHVWKPSPAIASRINTRPLHITLEENGTHEIGWLGLMQAAIAARHLKCDYLWLDFICLNQTSKADKKLQIKNMANIYAYCAYTIVMLGGVRCAQRLEDESLWHTRAWTLQEALESVRRGRNAVRYALIEWEYDKSFEVYRKGFQKLEEGMAIVPIRELLDLQGNPMPIAQIKHSGKYGPRRYGDRMLVPVHTFGENKEVIKSLLRLLYHPQELSKDVKLDSSIWRALWVRMSSREHDVLYSSMNLFSTPVQLDIDYQKDFETVLIHFLGTLHEKPSVPYWLSIGHRIPVYEWSGLLPKRPCFNKHEAPTYTIGKSEPVDAQELLCSRGCCSSLHLCVEITGASKEAGHTLCAKVLKLVRVAKTQTLPTYTDRRWQHVRKILISYITGRSEAVEGENWSFETDVDAVAEEVDTHSHFDEDTTVLNRFDYSTGHPVLPQHNKHELWIRSRTEGADLAPLENPSPEPGSVDMTALCWLDGRLGPYLAILGFYNTHYQNPVVYFFDRTKDGNVQRVGTGKLLLAETDRIRADIPWRHLGVGGSKVAPVFQKCVCEEKAVVPLIETGQNEWWSET
jgi:Heterokaryon incompatibility protein (HET)